jgi:hypothetical protein
MDVSGEYATLLPINTSSSSVSSATSSRGRPVCSTPTTLKEAAQSVQLPVSSDIANSTHASNSNREAVSPEASSTPTQGSTPEEVSFPEAYFTSQSQKVISISQGGPIGLHIYIYIYIRKTCFFSK